MRLIPILPSFKQEREIEQRLYNLENTYLTKYNQYCRYFSLWKKTGIVTLLGIITLFLLNAWFLHNQRPLWIIGIGVVGALLNILLYNKFLRVWLEVDDLVAEAVQLQVQRAELIQVRKQNRKQA